MASFTELIRNFDKIRDYMRDFYIYGFKSRDDFHRKSARSYDNEKRRIESYLGRYIRWNQDQSGKRTFVSLSSAQVAENPLYAAWKSKSFTDTDIMLHFALLDVLRGGEARSVGQLTDEICLLLGRTFDVQTVRGKCREYEREGVLLAQKQGKSLLYSLSADTLPPELADAVAFFTEAAPFGEVGSFLMDDAGLENSHFRFKHHFIVHTLEDGVLLEVLRAMREKRWVEITNFSEKLQNESVLNGVPLNVFASVVTGRRYVCLYQNNRRQFATYRLDYVKAVKPLDVFDGYDKVLDRLKSELPQVWGVSFGNRRKDILCMKLHINEEKEGYVLERLHREGRGGEVLKVADNIFLYTIELFDIGEISSWVKTFTGRIISLKGSDQAVIGRFYRDMERMKRMYLEAGK